MHSRPWGEHEVDYLLLVRLPKGFELPMAPNPEEVMDVAWVTAPELKEMMVREGLLAAASTLARLTSIGETLASSSKHSSL